MTINLALNLAILLVCVQVYLRTQLSNILSKVVMCLSALWICQKTFDRVNYWKLFVKLGVTFHRTGPHRATPDRTGPEMTDYFTSTTN